VIHLVEGAGGAATFVDRPNDERLSAAAIAGGKNAGNVC